MISVFMSVNKIRNKILVPILIFLWNWYPSLLFYFCLTSHSRIFHSYGDVTKCQWRASIFGLCSALTAIEKYGFFIVQTSTVIRYLEFYSLIRRTGKGSCLRNDLWKSRGGIWCPEGVRIRCRSVRSVTSQQSNSGNIIEG